MCENRWNVNLSEIPTGSRKRYDLIINKVNDGLSFFAKYI